MVVIKNIYAKQDVTIATQVETRKFKKGDYGLVKFLNEKEYDNLAALNLFIECITPPKKIEGTVSIPNSSVTPIPVIEAPVKNQLDAVPAANDVLQEGPVVEPQKAVCEVCNTFMVLITNAQKTEVMYCSGCDKEYPVAPPQALGVGVNDSIAVDAETKKTTYSRCPLCDKRKAAAVELCKKCQKAKDENDQNPPREHETQEIQDIK